MSISPLYSGLLRNCVRGIMAVAVMAGATVVSPASAETRSFVVDWFHLATYKHDGDCPDGPNPDAGELTRQILTEVGWSADKIRAVQLDQGKYPTEKTLAIKMRARVNGKQVNVWNDPSVVPDPNVHTVEGPLSLGFNLDSNTDTGGFENPETGEAGIDNQLYRALGCFHSYRTVLPARPSHEQMNWDWSRSMPPWTISVTGNDLDNDGEVAVSFDMGRSPIIDQMRSQGGGFLPDQTFVLTTNKRFKHQATGRIENGILTVDPFELLWEADASLFPEFNLVDAQISLDVTDWRAPAGFIGGYIPWIDYWFQYHSNAEALETAVALNVPGIYYAFEKMADAEPDPETGKNKRISGAWRIELVPAMLVSAE